MTETSLQPKCIPHLDEERLSCWRNRLTEIKEEFESGGTRLVKKLKAIGGGPVHVARLLHGESCRQLLPPNVHVE